MSNHILIRWISWFLLTRSPMICRDSHPILLSAALNPFWPAHRLTTLLSASWRNWHLRRIWPHHSSHLKISNITQRFIKHHSSHLKISNITQRYIKHHSSHLKISNIRAWSSNHQNMIKIKILLQPEDKAKTDELVLQTKSCVKKQEVSIDRPIGHRCSIVTVCAWKSSTLHNSRRCCHNCGLSSVFNMSLILK